MALKKEAPKKWKPPMVVTVVTVIPSALACTSLQATCTQDGNICAPTCGDCPSLDC